MKSHQPIRNLLLRGFATFAIPVFVVACGGAIGSGDPTGQEGSSLGGRASERPRTNQETGGGGGGETGGGGGETGGGGGGETGGGGGETGGGGGETGGGGGETGGGGGETGGGGGETGGGETGGGGGETGGGGGVHAPMCRGEGFQCVPRELSPACPEGTIRARYSCNEREVLTEDGPYCCAPEASVPPERR